MKMYAKEPSNFDEEQLFCGYKKISTLYNSLENILYTVDIDSAKMILVLLHNGCIRPIGLRY